MHEFEKYAKKHLGVNGMVMHDYFNAAAKLPMAMTPHVIEERKLNATVISVFDRLMLDRIIFLGMGINMEVANIINAQLLFLESLEKKDIQIYINSPGGQIDAGLGIYDVMQYINSDVNTVNTGICASMAFVLAISGTKGKRSSLRHARYMQHQPMSGVEGQASDIEIAAREVNKLKKELYQIIVNHTGQDYKKIEKDCDRDYWMTAPEAKIYGCVDEILEKKQK